MTARVRIEPGGEEFDVEGNEPVLDAALRSGLALDYGCRSGTCGECKARVVSGQTHEVKFHDYVISNADRAAGNVLLCSVTADTDLVLEAHAAHSIDEIPHQELTARVSKIERLTERVSVLHLKTPRTQPLRFFSGQFISLEFPGANSFNASVASCPCNGNQLQLHIYNNDDEFSRFVSEALRKNDSIDISGPYGSFVMHPELEHPLVMLAYGTGFAPVKSLIEDAIALDLQQPIHLYWIVDELGGHYMENYCRSWVDALDNFQFTPLVCSPDEARCEMAGSAVAGAAVVEQVPEQIMASAVEDVIEEYPDMSNVDVYISGPQLMADAAKAVFKQHGLSESQFYVSLLPPE